MEWQRDDNDDDNVLHPDGIGRNLKILVGSTEIAIGNGTGIKIGIEF